MSKANKIPLTLTYPEVMQLFGVMQRPEHRMWFGLMFYCGCRASEVVQMTTDMIDTKKWVMTLTGDICKNGRPRRVPVPTEFQQTCNHYLALRVPNPKVCDVKRGALHVAIKKYAEMAGLNPNIHCHTLRHSYATLVYKKTKDIGVVSKLLNHAHLSTTMIYVRIDDEDKDNAVKHTFG